MKIVVIGGTGLIGSKTVERLRKKGHEVLAASPNGGVNTITGEGPAGALIGAQVVIDLANSPSFEDKAVLENYMRAKIAQDRLIRDFGIPYTVVHSTQFVEFLDGIAQSGTVGDIATVPSAYFQPIAYDDVADIMTDVALGPPVNCVIEIAGPEPIRMSDLVARFLKATNDPRKVTADPHAPYFGTELDDRSLVPGDKPPRRIRFEEILNRGIHGLDAVDRTRALNIAFSACLWSAPWSNEQVRNMRMSARRQTVQHNQ